MPEPNGQTLLTMAEEVARAQARIHPGRPAFTALSRAERALKEAARELDIARPIPTARR